MAFPVGDVETNFRQFIASVKRATGNAKDPDVKSAGGPRPSTSRIQAVCADLLKLTLFPYSYAYHQGHDQFFSRTRYSCIRLLSNGLLHLFYIH